MEDEDKILALSLMKECVLSTKKCFTCVDALPKVIAPELDTFAKHDLDNLKDDMD